MTLHITPYFHFSICRMLTIGLLWGIVATTFAQQVTDSPRQGEGISAFLRRNGCDATADYDEFLRLNKKKLKGKRELQLGVSYVLPSHKKKKGTEKKRDKHHKEPLFGDGNSKVTVSGSSLRGACFYIVSGHGGPDPGAIGKQNGHELHEDEYAYDVALRLARNLMQEGAEVHIIIQDKKDGIRNERYLSNSQRETCMGKSIPLNHTQRLKQRTDAINKLYRKDRKKHRYCRAVFLHVDSRSKREQTDVFFYHAPGSSKGERLANTMRNTFENNYNKHQAGRGFDGTVEGRGLYVVRNTHPVALFVELGNIQNSFDQRRFVDYNNRQALAKWLMQGLIKDYQSNQ